LAATTEQIARGRCIAEGADVKPKIMRSIARSYNESHPTISRLAT
jgi:hypothetical protein